MLAPRSFLHLFGLLEPSIRAISRVVSLSTKGISESMKLPLFCNFPHPESVGSKIIEELILHQPRSIQSPIRHHPSKPYAIKSMGQIALHPRKFFPLQRGLSEIKSSERMILRGKSLGIRVDKCALRMFSEIVDQLFIIKRMDQIVVRQNCNIIALCMSQKPIRILNPSKPLFLYYYLNPWIICEREANFFSLPIISINRNERLKVGVSLLTQRRKCFRDERARSIGRNANIKDSFRPSFTETPIDLQLTQAEPIEPMKTPSGGLFDLRNKGRE